MPNRQTPREAYQDRRPVPAPPPPRPGSSDPFVPKAGDQDKPQPEERLDQTNDLGGTSGNDLA